MFTNLFKRIVSLLKASQHTPIVLIILITIPVAASTVGTVVLIQQAKSSQSLPTAQGTHQTLQPKSVPKTSTNQQTTPKSSTSPQTQSTTQKPSGSTPPSKSTTNNNSSTSQSGTTQGTPNTANSPSIPLYVQPGSQGYRGSLSALAVYSAANGQVPPGADCSWNQTYAYLRCNDTDLTLDHVYIQGGLYWAGCGSLKLTNSIFDWYPSQSWFDVYNACPAPNAGATITASYSTFETSPSVIHYTGGSDIGGIDEYTGDIPMSIDHSLVQGFSQGFDPGIDSIISSSEIYIQDNTCNGGLICHGDGLFSQGGDNITYKYNYIVSATDATSAIFYQSSPNSNGNSVIGNYLQGGSYALYNETSNGVTVENNTFGGSTYGNCSLTSANGASWGTWSGNVTTAGVTVVPEGDGCS